MLKGYDLSIQEFKEIDPKTVKVMRDTPVNRLKNITKAQIYNVVNIYQDMAMITGDDGSLCLVDKQYLLIPDEA